VGDRAGAHGTSPTAPAKRRLAQGYLGVPPINGAAAYFRNCVRIWRAVLSGLATIVEQGGFHGTLSWANAFP